MNHPFQIVDVFGAEDFSGNPVAVVTATDDLDPDLMQRITRWLNLSETTFLLPATDPLADYRVRIFTLERELPFAGHPTLGTCHAWLRGGNAPRHQDRIVQQCGAGLIEVRRRADALAFAAPPLIRSGPVDDAGIEEIVSFLGIARADIVASKWVDNGPGWVAVKLSSAAEVLALDPARSHPRRIELGVVGAYPDGASSAYEIRAFFSDQHGAVIEDPVCGSLNASVAQWMLENQWQTAPYTVSQGARVGRNGRISIEQDEDGRIWIGGRTRTLFSGEAHL